MKQHKSCWENGFTIPGESGHMDRVLELAERWGADAVRNSDGTQLPASVAESGYQIYSNVYLIRNDNEWIKKHPEMIQQIFLSSEFVQAAKNAPLKISLLEDKIEGMFDPNNSDEAMIHWQVYDRTEERLLDVSEWEYNEADKAVIIKDTELWHTYSINFMAYNIWEFVHWYNHKTNNWTTDPHIPMDPMHPEVRERIKENMANWLEAHPYVDVVRFTTFYYNTCGGVGNYNATISPRGLELFREKYGYTPTAESFIRQGQLNHAGCIPDKAYKDWVEFIHDFFMEITGVYIDMVHDAGKKAVFFFGDQWIGSEPYDPRFKELGMDGAISAVFSGFETRLVGDLDTVPCKEIRFHPYFFPSEVTGKKTFSEGGVPTEDLRLYWRDIRRACLRSKINRIGFGGMISLLEDYPDFVDYVEELSKQSSSITALHLEGAPYKAPLKVAVLGQWGAWRSWMFAGHMNYNSIYNNFLESLSGLPFEIAFLSFDEVVKNGVPKDIDVVVNCGREGTAWSGGENWNNPALMAAITSFVADGGGLIGIGEPSALSGKQQRFQLAPVLGVDRQALLPEYNVKCIDRIKESHFITADLKDKELALLTEVSELTFTSLNAEVLASKKLADCEYFYEYVKPQLVTNSFGSGRSVYFTGFKNEPANTRVLSRALYWAAGKENQWQLWQTNNPNLECAWFPKSGKLAVINNSDKPQSGIVFGENKEYNLKLKPLDMTIVN